MCETAMMAIDQKVVFLCGDRAFTLSDLLDAALFRGELQSAWNNLLRLLAAEQRADEHQLECSDETIDAAAERFRYEHDLITAEETEQWLTDRGLSLGDFGAFFVRHYWAEQADTLEPEAQDYLTAPNEMRELLVAELILSRELARMAQCFSWRVAAAREVDGKQVDPDLIAVEKTRFFERTSVPVEMLLDWLTRVGRDESWFREMLTLEAIFCRDTAALLSPQACEKEMASLRLPLTRFEIETIELDSLDAAREAFLCARDDGLAMEEVAAEGRYPFHHTVVALERIPENLQQRFLSVHPGDILEPIGQGDTYHVCRIVGKTEPELSDPSVKERAGRQILDRHLADLTTRHIQWRLLFA
jgi:hypothetical protein